MFELAQQQHPLRHSITNAYRQSEISAVASILSQIYIDTDTLKEIENFARELSQNVRLSRKNVEGIDALMQEYPFSTAEGAALISMVETLLRIPDKVTQEKFLRDKLSKGEWKIQSQEKKSFFANAASWGLMLTGKLNITHTKEDLTINFPKILAKGGEALIRQSINFVMQVVGKQYIIGQTVEDALNSSQKYKDKGYLFSFDMLRENAITQKDADRHFGHYVLAIDTIGKTSSSKNIHEKNNVSVKLSTIYPQFVYAQKKQVMKKLFPQLKELFLLAKANNTALIIDAEDTRNLDITLDLLEAITLDLDLAGYDGIGLTIQAYQKRCSAVIDYLADLGKRANKRIIVRLVKGDQWDMEIKQTQVEGLSDYPVFTRKEHTDASYLVSALKILSHQETIYPQFATHNAYLLSALIHLSKAKECEFECLYGMSSTLYENIVGKEHRCRIYSPVGQYDTLTSYLSQRLLENATVRSFVNQVVDENISIDDLVKNPIAKSAKYGGRSHESLPILSNLGAVHGIASEGVDLSNEQMLNLLQINLNEALNLSFKATSILADEEDCEQDWEEIHNPANHIDIIGHAQFLQAEDVVNRAIGNAALYQKNWQQISLIQRVSLIEKFTDLLEDNQATILMLLVREAGQNIRHAVNEFRSAIDLCRYHARMAMDTFSADATIQPLGIVASINAWSSPLVSCIGQATAALLTGNVVLVHPARETAFITHFMIQLLHQAGIPKGACQLLLGKDTFINRILTKSTFVNGIVFFGATSEAYELNKILAARKDNPSFIAESGGQNAMIVDSSALVEQAVKDILYSAFDYSGQRCGALRVLCVQEDIADRVIDMIQGGMREIHIGNPAYLHTDVGPVIDTQAQIRLLKYIEITKNTAKSYYENDLPADYGKGSFVVPVMFELENLTDLKEKIFGPVLHVVRYRADDLENVVSQLNQLGYILSCGVHSRIDDTVTTVCNTVEAENFYINRDMIEALVGVRPNGGYGLTGIAPQATSYFYLPRFCKLSVWRMPESFISGDSFAEPFTILENKMALCTFLDEGCRTDLKLLVEEEKQQNYFNSSLNFSGLIGEENTMRLRNRENIFVYTEGLCYEVLMALVKVAASGGRVCVTSDSPLSTFNQVMPEVVRIVDDISDCQISLCLVQGELPIALKQKCAESKHRRIISFIEIGTHFSTLQLFEEKYVSKNMLVTGGDKKLSGMST